MALPELVVPVLSTVGPVGLAYVILLRFPQATRALLEALATIVAIFGRDEQHRQRGLDVLDKLTGSDGDRRGLDQGLRDDDTENDPPSLPRSLAGPRLDDCPRHLAMPGQSLDPCYLTTAKGSGETGSYGVSGLVLGINDVVPETWHAVDQPFAFKNTHGLPDRLP